jgi:hypothetical protein
MVIFIKRTQIKLISHRSSASGLSIVQSKWAFEVNQMKITTKLAILFAASLLVLAPTAVIVFAQPSGSGTVKERGYVRSFVEPLLIGHGFALNGAEYHILDVTAIKTVNVSSSYIRSLLSQNKTRAEIAMDIQNYTQNAPTKTRGNLRFAGQAYSLNIITYDNQSLTADVLTLPPRGTNYSTFIPATVGNISLSMSNYEGVGLATGNLTINSTNYNVMLTSPMKRTTGQFGSNNVNGMFRPNFFNGMFGQRNRYW